eukprot:8810384-Pyramimonas_sp.AAC.1
MAADPKRLSVGPQEHLDPGAIPISQTDSTTCARLLEDLHILCRRLKRAPVVGNMAWGVCIAKRSGKVGALWESSGKRDVPYLSHCEFESTARHVERPRLDDGESEDRGDQLDF